MAMVNDLALQPTSRFSNRVENYVKYRPSYPEDVILFMEEMFGLHKENAIADIGSGTGLFAELFLKKGYTVTCIEPNDAMRKAGEKRLASYPGFISNNNRAEETGLQAGSTDLITVAQAFHWMEPIATKEEFARILKPGGHIALAWNVRLTHTDFLHEFELLKQKFGIDYNGLQHAYEPAIKAFLSPSSMGVKTFPNIQWLTFEGLKGQLLSASYIPLPGHEAYDDMIDMLTRIFVKYNERGLVKMEFETKLYWND